MSVRFPTFPLMIALTAGHASAVAAAEPGPIDYAEYARTLSAYVNADGNVHYQGLQEDRADLDRFVDRMAAIDPTAFAGWSEAERLALWINAYNALTLKAVIDHYPVDSIRDIGSLLQSVWDKLTFTVMGRALTLNQIEHEILRKEFAEPRIHMAINCASIGCPPLLNEPFRADRLDEQFTRVTRVFLSRDANFRIDRKNRTVYLSSLFDWFGDDFIPRFGPDGRWKGLNRKQAASVRFVAEYLPEADRAFLDSRGKLDVKYLDYDWGLNTQ